MFPFIPGDDKCECIYHSALNSYLCPPQLKAPVTHLAR